MAAAVRVTPNSSNNKEHKDKYLSDIGFISYCKKRLKKDSDKKASTENKLKAYITKI